MRRNRLVADLLFRARYVERVGSGIPRMRQALEENGNPPMEIAASNFFVVTFRPRLDTESPLSARQSRLYQFVAGRPRTAKEEAATFLAVSGDTALRELRALRGCRARGARRRWAERPSTSRTREETEPR